MSEQTNHRATGLPVVDRAAGLQAAVAARRARAAVKAVVASRQRTPIDVLRGATREPGSAEGTLRVSDLLRAIPGIGVTKVERIMTELDISPVKRLGGLGQRQQRSLHLFLRTWAAQHGGCAGQLTVLAGPTAVGKGTVSVYIRQNYPEVSISISATTRLPRPGEVEGKTYFFVDDAEFDRMIREGELLEWATVHNAYRYGTPREPVESALAAGQRVLLEIDIQGARSVRQVMPEASFIFLLPPTWEELVRRLTGRGTESTEEQMQRLRSAEVELAAVTEFDFRVVNKDVATAAREVVDLMG
ncbi:MAG: guanylate kinase [Candidatus Lumbricidophila eiseniae]|uniref:Guanylate kinase n=1 Tax=Candidatus Lumbricidiphila eiseniae TaxID=1969409 RepID=A0A2A6FMV0_9MICO|nr:MAG: guanylate kinase [Candidatus Lumbricidophila eiseniae]